MNLNNGKISNFNKKNKQIIFGTLNTIFIYIYYISKKKSDFYGIFRL